MNGVIITLIVAAAGGLGSVIRLLLANWQTKLPIGILAANILGSFFAGVVVGAYDLFTESQLGSSLVPIIISGLCGGLSTFSSFAAGTVTLIKSGQRGLAVLNSLLNFVFPSTAVLFGLAIGAALLN